MNTERCPHSELEPGIHLPWHWLASHGTRIAKRSLPPGCWLAWLAVLILGVAIRGDAAPLLGEWPEFLGPTGQGLSEAKRVPWQWSATNNIAWRMSMPGKGWSSPVLSRGRLYLTTAVAGLENLSLRALCLDASDGRVVWDVEVVSRVLGAVPRGHSKNGDASPTPVVRGDRLYVHFGHLGTAALDLTGKILWRSTELNYPPVHGNGGSPALVGDALIFSADGASDPFIVALDARTGKVLWKRARTSPRESGCRGPGARRAAALARARDAGRLSRTMPILPSKATP